MYKLEEIKKILNIKEQEENKDSWTDEEASDAEDRKPFTPFEVNILKLIHRNLTPKEMEALLIDHTSFDLNNKWADIAKLIGLAYWSNQYNNPIDAMAYDKKYIKWALDNWSEDGDYASIKNPIKIKPKRYRVTKSESGSQVVHKSGDVEVIAFDEDSAADSADFDFWEWGGDMEEVDWGDYDVYDSQIDNVKFLKTLNENKKFAKLINEYISGNKVTKKEIVQFLKENINDMVYRDEPTKKHIKKMNKSLGPLEGFPIEKFKNMPPPENESTETEEEIDYLDSIPVEDEFVKSADEIHEHFNKFLKTKNLEFPEKELEDVMKGVKSIILQLKYHYNRPRPNQVADAKNLKLDSEHLDSAKTPSYPSGHATQGTFIGRYLADLYPEYEKELRQIGEDIAFSRNMAKVHYPSDSEFGKMLGNDLYEFVYQPEVKLNENSFRSNRMIVLEEEEEMKRKEKLLVPERILTDYANKYHREKLKKELTPILECLMITCYGINPSNKKLTKSGNIKFYVNDEVWYEHNCGTCGDTLDNILQELDGDLIKMGFLKGSDRGFLTKPFPREYNNWVEGVIQEINPNFYIDDYDEITYGNLGIPEDVHPENWAKKYNISLNERKFGEKIKNFTNKKKEDFKKFWSTLRQGAKRESKETREAVKILGKLLSNEENVTKEEIKFLKQQSGDIARIIALLGLGAVSVVIPIGLEKILNKYNISMMPRKRSQDKDGNEIDDHIDATQDDNLLNESKQEISPELEEGDLIKVIDIGWEATTMEGQEIIPEIFITYKVVRKIPGGKYRGVRYDLIPEGGGVVLDVFNDEIQGRKSIFDGDTWIKVNPAETLNESKENISPVLESGDVITVLDVPTPTEGFWEDVPRERRQSYAFGEPKLFTPYWVWKPSYGTPRKEGTYIVVPLDKVSELQKLGHLKLTNTNLGVPGHLHIHLKVINRSRGDQWIKTDQKEPLNEQLENTQDKIAILFDGTSSAGKSYTAKQLNAVPFHKATDPNEWVVIDSDHFSGMGNDEEKRRLKLDHPNIRDWAKDFESGIVSGLYRKGGTENCIKDLEQSAKKEGREFNPSDVEKCKNIPENPYEDEYIEGTDPRLWYMAQEFKTGPWKKVIFDDIGNNIEKYVPNIKHKLLIHSPIYVMLGNIKSRNDKAVKQNDESLSRNPKDVLKQYLEKYEATTSEPKPTVGDPTTVIQKGRLKTMLMDAMTETYPNYDEQYIDEFIDNLGIKDDNAKYWIKVKDNYLSEDQVLINVGDDQQTYITNIKDEYFSPSNSLNEQTTPQEINPELKLGDYIRVINVDKDTPIAKLENWPDKRRSDLYPADTLPRIFDVYRVFWVTNNHRYLDKVYILMGTDLNPSKQTYLLPTHDSWIKISEEEGLKEFKKYIDSVRNRSGENLNESKEELNPELKQGDFIRIYNVDKDSPIISREGYTDQDRYMMYGGDSIPEIFKVYVVMMSTTHKRMGREGEKNEKIYVLLGPDMNTRRLVYLIPTHDTWVKIPREEGNDEFMKELETRQREGGRMGLNESTQTNQPLKRGDEVMIVDLDHNTQGYVTGRRPNSLVTPKTFTPYRIFGITHRQRENWEGPDTDTRIYKLEPIDITDEERFEDSISGGGRRIGLHMIPGDTWILQKRPENWYDNLHESRQEEINPRLEIGDKIKVIEIDGEHDRMPKLFTTVYEVVNVGIGVVTGGRWYDLLPENFREQQKRYRGGERDVRDEVKTIYRGDVWIKANPIETLNEQTQPTELSPDLEEGDEILVVDIDRDRESGRTMYTSPIRGYRPERYIPYVVIDKESNGAESKWPWKYVVIEKKILEKALDKWNSGEIRATYSDKSFFDQSIENNVKFLYPWVYQWIKLNSGKLPAITVGGELAHYKTLKEQQFPFNPNNKDIERDHPEGEPDWSIRRGDQHYAMNVENTPNEPVAAFNNYLVKNSPFIIDGFDFYLSAVPGNMPQSAIVDVYVPMMDDSALADDIWDTDRTYYIKNPEMDTYVFKKLESKLHDINYSRKLGEFTYYDDFQEQHPEYIEYLKRELGDTNLLNEPGAKYELIWRNKRKILKSELNKMSKLFGISDTIINRDPMRPWKRQRDSYGNEKIRPGKPIPRGWPRP